MMRVIIERVTCDDCGLTFDFEKWNGGTNTARIEPLSKWMERCGWNLTDGVNHVDVCPNCVQQRKVK